MEKDPVNYALATYAWVIVLASWGGIAGYIRKLRTGGTRFSLGEVIGDICISGFVGVITFYFCEASGFNQVMSAAFVGISGHMGSRGIFMLENMLTRFIDNKFGGHRD